MPILKTGYANLSNVILSPVDSGGNNGEISYSPDSRRNDGTMEIAVAADRMSAVATLYPPLGDGAPLNPDYAAELLSRLGITYGVLWDELKERILNTNIDRRIDHEVLIARGLAPVASHPEYIILEERFTGGFKPLDEDEQVDWKAISSIPVVRKGERIGTVIVTQQGISGFDIFGAEIPCKTEPMKTYTIGKNVEIVDLAVMSTMDGRVQTDGQRLSVEEVLIIKGNVDYHVGHVLFPGDVVIEGTVAAGFKVYSGGSISIKETMDATDISAKRDLLCAQGIIGKDQGFVRVGGSLKAKFIDAARVATRGDVEVPGSIVGCRIYTLGHVTMGDKGKIVGGEMYASHGISCGYLGGVTRPLTVVNVGMDFTIQQKLDQASAALRELSTRLSRFIDLLKERQEPALLKAKQDTEAKLHALAANIAELSKRVDIDDDARVEVKNAVYPGVTITICHVHITIMEPLKKTSFRLDKNANKIIVEH
jgi:uncharacterized protein